MQSIALTLFGLIALIGTSEAAVLITIDEQGSTETDVFDNQVYYHLENGTLDSRIDLKTNTCSMFLHEHRVHLESKCDEAQKEMEAAMSEALQQQGILLAESASNPSPRGARVLCTVHIALTRKEDARDAIDCSHPVRPHRAHWHQ